MSINIQAKTNYSFLFSNMSQGLGGSSSMSSLLSDYASIKNGSYAKLMKAYYKESASDSVKSLAKNKTERSSKKITSEESKAYTQVQTSTDALKESADALLSKSLFEKKDITTTDENGVESTVKDYDRDAIYKAVNKFVSSYNSTMKAVEGRDNSTVQRRVESLENLTAVNTKNLKNIGITVNADNTLSIDKDAFGKADVSKIKTMFNGNGSYGYQVSAQASLINYAADSAVRRGSSYTVNGTSSSGFNTGNLFNQYF